MAKSNKERQQEFRDRKRAKAENAEPAPQPAAHSHSGTGTPKPVFSVDYWWHTVEGVVSQAKTVRVIAIPGEAFAEFDARVRAASGPGPWEVEAGEVMKRKIVSYRKLGPNSRVPQQAPAPMPIQAGR